MQFTFNMRDDICKTCTFQVQFSTPEGKYRVFMTFRKNNQQTLIVPTNLMKAGFFFRIFRILGRKHVPQRIIDFK